MFDKLAGLTVPPEPIGQRFGPAPVGFRADSHPMHALTIYEAQGDKGGIPAIPKFSSESLRIFFAGKAANLHGPARNGVRRLFGWRRLFCRFLFGDRLIQFRFDHRLPLRWHVFNLRLLHLVQTNSTYLNRRSRFRFEVELCYLGIDPPGAVQQHGHKYDSSNN